MWRGAMTTAHDVSGLGDAIKNSRSMIERDQLAVVSLRDTHIAVHTSYGLACLKSGLAYDGNKSEVVIASRPSLHV